MLGKIKKQDLTLRPRVDKEQLAFDMDPAAGEVIYETIFAAPVPTVVDKLRKYDSRKELWLDLPRAF